MIQKISSGSQDAPPESINVELIQDKTGVRVIERDASGQITKITQFFAPLQELQTTFKKATQPDNSTSNLGLELSDSTEQTQSLTNFVTSFSKSSASDASVSACDADLSDAALAALAFPTSAVVIDPASDGLKSSDALRASFTSVGTQACLSNSAFNQEQSFTLSSQASAQSQNFSYAHPRSAALNPKTDLPLSPAASLRQKSEPLNTNDIAIRPAQNVPGRKHAARGNASLNEPHGLFGAYGSHGSKQGTIANSVLSFNQSFKIAPPSLEAATCASYLNYSSPRAAMYDLEFVSNTIDPHSSMAARLHYLEQRVQSISKAELRQQKAVLKQSASIKAVPDLFEPVVNGIKISSERAQLISRVLGKPRDFIPARCYQPGSPGPVPNVDPASDGFELYPESIKLKVLARIKQDDLLRSEGLQLLGCMETTDLKESPFRLLYQVMVSLASKHPEIPDTQICAALGMPLRMKYYYQQHPIKDPYEQVEPIIRKCFADHHGLYGKNRLTKALKEEYGIVLSVPTVGKLMKRFNLVVVPKSQLKTEEQPSRVNLEESLAQPPVSLVGELLPKRQLQGEEQSQAQSKGVAADGSVVQAKVLNEKDASTAISGDAIDARQAQLGEQEASQEASQDVPHAAEQRASEKALSFEARTVTKYQH